MAYSNELWSEAKRKCRLNAEEISIAKELGINPRSLIKNIPSPSQQWKAPVGVWLRELKEKQMEKSARKAKKKQKAESEPKSD